jgi:Asp-tRNA(Asn)/Glu-tRNA(Gln) amidotransferase A subunit family amidase
MVRKLPHSRGSAVKRRTFLLAAPTSLAAGMFPPVAAEEQSADETTTSRLRSVGALLGLAFTDAERQLMQAAVERNRERYATLRDLIIPNDTEPAVAFYPYLPGERPTGVSTPNTELPIVRPATLSAPDAIESLAFEPVTVVSRLLERREVTSVDLTRMYLDRLRRYGNQLNCVITLTDELALSQAATADTEIRAGRYRGPLHGIPWGAKDPLATRGVRTTWGAKPYKFQIIDNDATVVRRLQEAGAVLVAKLSMGALAQGGVWFGGSTRNPWDVSRSSSGSSAACGATGLRPTYGRVSRHGAMALSWTMDKIGPICRSVEDCALVFNAIYGADGQDTTVVDAPFEWDTAFQPSRLRVGYVASELEAAPDGASDTQRRSWTRQSAVLLDAFNTLRDAGITLEPIELPEFPADTLRLILNAEAATAFDDLTRDRGVDQLTQQGPGGWPNRFRSARFIPAVEYIRAQRARTLLMQEMHDLMSRYDAFLSPTLSRSLTITNLTGHPALALKAGFRDGLPTALMITGRPYEEATVLQLAAVYERATAWHTMHPGGFGPAQAV